MIRFEKNKMRHAICYVSNSSTDLNDQQIVELLRFCKDRNEKLGIKGVLLYSEGNFLQILEGEKEVVLSVYEKIKEDSRHYGVIRVIGRDIERGSLDGYKTGIIKGELLYEQEVPEEYIEALQGIPSKIKEPMERMLTMFVATQ